MEKFDEHGEEEIEGGNDKWIWGMRSNSYIGFLRTESVFQFLGLKSSTKTFLFVGKSDCTKEEFFKEIYLQSTINFESDNEEA